MGDGIDVGCGWRLAQIVCVAGFVIGLLFGLSWLISTDHTGIERDRAEAARLQAQASLEQQRHENMTERYMLFVTTVTAISHDWLTVVSVGALALVLLWLYLDERRWQRRHED